MSYRAVIFDLFGTLIPSFSGREYRSKIAQVSQILSIHPEEFWKVWSDTFDESMLGMYPDLESRIYYLCHRINVNPDNDTLIKAVEVLTEYSTKSMLPRPEAAEVIRQLKSIGYKIGLISDCSPETPGIWKNISIAELFDVAVFSSVVGIRKPNPDIYKLAVSRLGVNSKECIYVGDGSGHELTGAAIVGMFAIQLYLPDEDEKEVLWPKKEEWTGIKISTLKEILPLITEITQD